MIIIPTLWRGASGRAPDETARREVEEETGLRIERFEPFRAYYFAEQRTNNGKRTAAAARARAEYELYMYHAPCTTPAESMTCGEGRGLRFFAPPDVDALDIAYNHRDVLADFFASPVYARYVPVRIRGNGRHHRPCRLLHRGAGRRHALVRRDDGAIAMWSAYASWRLGATAFTVRR
jgi:ADP-ribose pyrophosphatase YjhB (NUDIX family)